MEAFLKKSENLVHFQEVHETWKIFFALKSSESINLDDVQRLVDYFCR
jgi:hypothetical protein